MRPASTQPFDLPRDGARRFVVTGCAGFIGSHLTEALLDAGHGVLGIDAFTDYYAPARKRANAEELEGRAGFDLVEASLGRVDLTELFDGAAGVYHLAAQPGVRASWGTSFGEYVERNVLATQAVFEAAVATGTRVVFASSSSVYGNAEGYPTVERTWPRPVSPYGVTKAACEQLAAAYGAAFGLDVVALRYFTVYGPRQRPDMAFSRVVAALLDGSTFTVYGDGRQSRDFTFVADAVAATIASMEAAPAGAVYNVGGGQEASLREVIALCEEISGRTLDLVHRDRAAGDVGRTAADTTLIRGELGWNPEVGLAQGLSAQIEHASAQRVARRAAR